jgi:hypothetical protein
MKGGAVGSGAGRHGGAVDAVLRPSKEMAHVAIPPAGGPGLR